MSQRIWNIGIVDMICIVLLCFLYFIMYQGAHGDTFIENTALVLMFFCAVVILSTTASLLHAMFYSIPGYREPHFGASYYNRRRQELHNHFKKSLRGSKPPKLIPYEAPPRPRDLNIQDLIMLHDSMMSLNQFMMSHGTSQQLFYNPQIYDYRYNERHENIHENNEITYPVWQNGSLTFSDSLNPPKEMKCKNCNQKLISNIEHKCEPCKNCSKIPCVCNNESTCKTCSNLYSQCKCSSSNTNDSDSSEHVTIPISDLNKSSYNIISMDSLNYNSLGYDVPKSITILPSIQQDSVEYVTPIIIRSEPIKNYESCNKEPNPYAGPLIPPPCENCMENMTICTHNSNFDDSNNEDSKSESETEEAKIVPLCKNCSNHDSNTCMLNKSKLLVVGNSEVGSFASERVDNFKSVQNMLSPVSTL